MATKAASRPKPTTGESLAGYFGAHFAANPALLKMPNLELVQMWARDHPGQPQPKNILQGLNNTKSVMRKRLSGRKRKRVRTTSGSTVSIPGGAIARANGPAVKAVGGTRGGSAVIPIGPTGSWPTVGHGGKGSLAALEAEIDQCLMIARGTDPAGLASAIGHLVQARRAVVLRQGA